MTATSIIWFVFTLYVGFFTFVGALNLLALRGWMKNVPGWVKLSMIVSTLYASIYLIMMS
ncbi:MAG: hypothetical protein AAB652_02120 [Patescibacteria group bacterium]